MRDKSMMALFSMIASIAFSALTDAFIKLMVEHHYSPFQVIGVRNWSIVLLLLVWGLWSRQLSHLLVQQPFRHLLRGLYAAVAIYGITFAFKTISMSEAGAIGFSATFIMTLLSIFLFKEKVGLHRWGAIVLGFIGVLIVTGVTSSSFKIGALYAFLSAIGYTLWVVTTRLMSGVHSIYVLLFFPILGVALFSLPSMLSFWTPMTTSFLFLSLGAVISSLLFYFFMAIAFMNTEISILAPFEYTYLPWAVMFDFLLWHTLPSFRVGSGISIILLGSVYTVYRERKKAQKTS